MSNNNSSTELRRPKYLSPTSLGQYYGYGEEFFLQRLCPNPPPRMAQTIPMAVGSAFDAYVKNSLYEHFIGKSAGTEYDLSVMLNEQVEIRTDGLRDAVISAGAHCMGCYKRSGALASLAQDLGRAIMGSIHMEKTVTATIQGVPLLGKPDLSFLTGCASGTATFILDWKVNGYMSASGVSPKPGYSMCRDGWDSASIPHSRSHNKPHKDYMHQLVCGIGVNGMRNLESVDLSWARQVSTYSWVLASRAGNANPVGDEIYCGIDQLACKQLRRGTETEMILTPPEIRIASFRMGLGKAFQLETMEQYKALWGLLSLDDDLLMKRFFGPAGEDEDSSYRHCQMLINSTATSYSDEDKWFDATIRAR